MIIKTCDCDNPPHDMGLWPTNANLAKHGPVAEDGSFIIEPSTETIFVIAHRYWCDGCRTYYSTLSSPTPHEPAFVWPEQP